MQTQAGSRKRPAPGTTPMTQHQQTQPGMPGPFPYPAQEGANFEDQLNSFANPLVPDTSAYDSNLYPAALNAPQSQAFGPHIAPAPPQSSNQLVRRNTSQQLAARKGGYQQDQWNGFPSGSTPDRIWENMEEDDGQSLDHKAAIAKKDAQSKRKQIPPFVQKLSSFLDSSNNTDLIRWSDDGNSFIVLDEDEFARTLIPELFKHNNYASFVRQLNMYGFHKKVGLNANSMKAAEKKIKDPSVYWHEYFKRGRPDLLWLIQKPQGKSASAKRKRDGDKGKDHDSDEDGRRGSPETEHGVTRPGQVRGQSQDLVSVPRSEVTNLRQEVQKMQRQQALISQMIAQLKEQNDQFYRQATAFQALHDRHENSINAILTFLATFYNRSLDGHAQANLVNMFNTPMPQNNQQQGSVVDVGDYHDVSTEDEPQLQRFNINNKRPLALLPAPVPGARGFHSGTATTASNSARSSISPPEEPALRGTRSYGTKSSSAQPQNRISTVSPAIKDDAETPNVPFQYPENEDIMGIINNANAHSSSSPRNTGNPAFDFNSALNHYQNANGNAPLTPQERDDVLSLIARSQAGENNALTTPNPPVMPSLDQIAQTQQQLDMLTKLQQEQDTKVAELSSRLQPLSPTGSIPGLYNGQSRNFDDTGAPGDFDINDFIDSGDNQTGYFNFNGSAAPEVPNPAPAEPNLDFTGDDTGLNWDFDAGDEELFGEPQDKDGGGRVESISSRAGSPPVHEIDGETPPKKRRVAP